jgi:hypothetical protein
VFSLNVGSHGASYPLRGNIPFGTISRGGTHGYDMVNAAYSNMMAALARTAKG